MDAQRWAAIEPLYHAALVKDPEERAAFLAEVCGGDTPLREEVESLVAFAGAEIESPTRREELEELWQRAANSQPAPTPILIGRYRIVRLVGEGGMGAVYEAEQDQPRRTVALKVVKCGFSTPNLFRRFEKEFQALGRLQHPGIAQIYEAGTADNGFGPRPYFAMEFIRGEPLTRYAETHALNLRQRLKIMARICEAVNHAHQRGIIHRDLKPANILVDQTGQPKILDFGVARLTDTDPQVTHQTDFGRLMGTLDYMSPEQTLADPLEVDARSDVYSLGVILYEILAGQLPYKVSPDLAAALQTMREEDAAPLSTISRAYRGDIEIIVGKALEKDRSRRYSSAAELAAEIERYLQHEPIAAHRPSTLYQMRKFARRHKGLVAGATSVLLVLVGGIVASTWEAARARRAEQTAEAVSEFLQKDLLAQAGSLAQSSSRGRADPNLKVRTALDRAAAGIGARFAAQPLVEASIRETIGETYLDLGLFLDAQKQCERALDLRRRVLGPDDRSTLTSARTLAIVYGQAGQPAAAETLLKKTLQSQRRVLGSRHSETLSTMQQLALLDERQGALAEAWQSIEEYVEGARRVYGKTAPQTLAGLQTEGEILSTRGKYAEAEALFTQVVEARRRLLGEDNLETADSLSMLAVNYGRESKFAEGARALERALDVQQRQLGLEHDRTLDSMVVLAWLYQELGEYRQAEVLTLKAMEAQRRLAGPDLPYLRSTVHRLASIYREEGRYAEAEALNSKALDFWRRSIGSSGQIESMNDLARTYREEGKYPQAEEWSLKAVAALRSQLGEQHLVTLNALGDLALVYQGERRYAEAEALSAQVIEGRRTLLGPANLDTLAAMSDLALIYEDQGKYEQTEPLLTTVLDGRRGVLGGTHPKTLASMINLGELWIHEQKYGAAETSLREALAGFEKIDPGNWRRYQCESLLGATLAARRSYSEAEPLVTSGYRGMLARKAAIPASSAREIEEAWQRLAEFRNSH